MKKNILFIFWVLPTLLFSQNYSENLFYKLGTNEKFVINDEYKVLVYNGLAHNLVFLKKDSLYYIQYDKSKFGPFESIQESESNPSYLDWAVKKNGQWYQLILDKGKEYGPFENVIDVYRDNSSNHFGFRANNGNANFVVIDGEIFGPYEYLEQGFPKFSQNGNNWMFVYRKGSTYYAKSKFEELNMTEWKINYGDLFLNNDNIDFLHLEGLNYGYSSIGLKVDAGESGLVYFLSDPKLFPKTDEWNSPKVKDFEYNNKKYYALITSKLSLVSRNGQFGKSFNTELRSDFYEGAKLAIVQNYMVKEDGKYIPIYSNNPSGVTQERGKWRTTKEPIKIDNFIYLENKILGPFDKIEKYSFARNQNNDFVCIVNSNNELMINGKLSGVKDIKSVLLCDNSSAFISVTRNDEVYFNKKSIGNFKNAVLNLSSDGKSYGIFYEKNSGEYFYRSNMLNQEIGPIMISDYYKIKISKDFKNIATNDGTISINGKKFSERAFSLEYVESENSFVWLTFKDNELHKHSYNLK